MASMVTPPSAPPAYADQVLTYQYDCSHLSTPRYSDTPDASERLLESAPSSPVTSTLARAQTGGSLESDFIYETDHMVVNLGSRIWDLRTPAYGFEGHIEGCVKLLGDQAHVKSVEIKLHGDIVTRTSQFGQISGQESVRFLHKTITLYSSVDARRMESSIPWNGEHRFSFALPSCVDIKGKRTPLPASFTSYLPSACCEITYVLKIDMVRKGLRRHEKARIPVLYLPKSRPSQPSTTNIPWPSRNVWPPFQGDRQIRSVALDTYRPCKRPSSAQSNLSTCQSVYLSIPSSPSFTSGEHIPFILSLVFPDAPALPALLTRNIHIELIKRTRLFSGLELGLRDISVGAADIRNISEPADGISYLSGVIQAGQAGREHSWMVHGFADVQYFIRTTIQPPKAISCHLPTWRNEMEVKLTTDLWGTSERELIATGGTPTPALALASAGPRATTSYSMQSV